MIFIIDDDYVFQVLAIYKAELTAQLAEFDKYLLKRTFLVGERLTLADVSIALDLLPTFQVSFPLLTVDFTTF